MRLPFRWEFLADPPPRLCQSTSHQHSVWVPQLWQQSTLLRFSISANLIQKNESVFLQLLCFSCYDRWLFSFFTATKANREEELLKVSAPQATLVSSECPVSGGDPVEVRGGQVVGLAGAMLLRRASVPSASSVLSSHSSQMYPQTVISPHLSAPQATRVPTSSSGSHFPLLAI